MSRAAAASSVRRSCSLVPSRPLGEARQFPAQLRARLLRPARRGHGAFERFGPGGQAMMGARGLVGAHVRRPSATELAGTLCLLGGASSAAFCPRQGLGGDPASGEQVGSARCGPDRASSRLRDGAQLSAPSFPLPGFPGEFRQLGVDLRDPLLTVRGAGGRPDVPGPVRDVPAAQRAVAPAAVRGHRRGGAGVVKADAAQDRGDHFGRQLGGRVRTQRDRERPGRPRTARPGRTQQQLTVGGPQGAVGLDDRAEQARRRAAPPPARPSRHRRQVAGEVDTPP